jgi:hypothetical protein
VFRHSLIIPSPKGSVPYREVEAVFQREHHAAVDPALIALRDGRPPEPPMVWYEATKGAAKDFFAATVVLYLLLFRPSYFRGVVGAGDLLQAREIRDLCHELVRLNPWMAECLEVQAQTILSTRTESKVEMLTSDEGSGHGKRPLLTIINELVHHQGEAFAATLEDDATKMAGLVLVLTNAGHLGTWQHRWREHARTSPDWLFLQYAKPAPWISPKHLADREAKSPPHRFNRLFLGKWLPNVGDALDAQALADAIDRDLKPMTGREEGWAFGAGLDLGIKRNRAAFVIAARNVVTGRYRIAHITSWKPSAVKKVEITAVESAILDLHDRFGFTHALADPWQGELLSDRINAAGVPITLFNYTEPNLDRVARNVINLFSERLIGLCPDPLLIRDFQLMAVEEKVSGKIRLRFAKTADNDHGDVGEATSLALLAASSAWESSESDFEFITGGGFEVPFLRQSGGWL